VNPAPSSFWEKGPLRLAGVRCGRVCRNACRSFAAGRLPLFDGRKPIEVIEDVVPLRGVAARLRLAQAPSRVYSAYGDEEKRLSWTYEWGVLKIEVARLELHEAIVVEEGG